MASHIGATHGMLLRMRTTIDLNDELLRAAKRRAAQDGTTLRELFTTALRRYLEPARARADYHLSWRSERGELLPGVVLEDRDSLFEVMEGSRPRGAR